MTGLSAPEATPKVVETHISVLFFVYDKVYKLRKPVRFGFLDFTDQSRRRVDCDREVMLNRRLAPDVYLGVADVVIDGEPIDHMVVMRRMPDERRLSLLARKGDEVGDLVRQVARTMAAFHGSAERSSEIAAAATAASVGADWKANFAEAERFAGSLLDERTEREIRTLVARWVAGRGPLLESRIASGHVCDGHGDLQADDIFCLDDGIRILDCLEFSDRMRYCDTAADVAFLAMDLERLGRSDAARGFVAEYEGAVAEEIPRSLLHHYCASRAYVRTKVACLRYEQGSEASRAEAVGLQALTLTHLRRARVTLVMVGGTPGSGKSTLASGIAGARDWAVLRSDEIRLELLPIQPESETGYMKGRYSPASTGLVYEEMLRRAERLLEMGQSVVLDASWSDADRRLAASALADRTSSDLVELRCEVDPEVGASRIVRRLSEHADVSEATPELAVEMSRSMGEWESAVSIDTTVKSPEQAVVLALEALPPQ
ncbi:MAG: AAA family ATPase [Acidimicrobiales bacterium]